LHETQLGQLCLSRRGNLLADTLSLQTVDPALAHLIQL